MLHYSKKGSPAVGMHYSGQIQKLQLRALRGVLLQLASSCPVERLNRKFLFVLQKIAHFDAHPELVEPLEPLFFGGS